jgi:hypothetical protein
MHARQILEGHVFPLGDHSAVSIDSRWFGPVRMGRWPAAHRGTAGQPTARAARDIRGPRGAHAVDPASRMASP